MIDQLQSPIPPPVRSALLVIDAQKGLFSGPVPPHRADEVVGNINLLIAKARLAGAPVCFAQHSGPPGTPVEPGCPTWALLDGLDVAVGDHVFSKTRPSVFWQTGLDAWLRAAGVGRLVVSGLKTEYCVDTACRVGFELGYRMVLAADAHSTMGSPVLSPDAAIAHHNHLLGTLFARCVPTAAVSFEPEEGRS